MTETKPQIQESKRITHTHTINIQYYTSLEIYTVRHIIEKLLKTKDKENLQVSQRKRNITHRGTKDYRKLPVKNYVSQKIMEKHL